jgi:hypothetical protein
MRASWDASTALVPGGMMGIALGLKDSTHGDAEIAAYSTWDMMISSNDVHLTKREK